MKGVWKKYAITPFACFSFSKVLLKKILFIGYLVVRGAIGMGQDLNKPHDASREAPVHLWLYRQICKETFFLWDETHQINGLYINFNKIWLEFQFRKILQDEF